MSFSSKTGVDLAALVAQHLQQEGIEVVLGGG